MNIFTLIFGIVIILILIWRVRNGFKKGFVQELISTLSIMVAFIAAKILLSGVVAFFEGRFGKFAYTLLILAIVMAIYEIVKLIMKAFKLFSKLPVIKWIDKLLGIIAGVVEAFLIILFLIGLIKIWI